MKIFSLFTSRLVDFYNFYDAFLPGNEIVESLTQDQLSALYKGFQEGLQPNEK